MSGRRALAALAVAAVLLPTAPLGAQSAACAEPVALQDACQKAADLFAFVMPQLGMAIAGGNATLGQGSNLGGLGRFSIGLRMTGARGELPRPEPVGVVLGPAQASTFPVSRLWFAVPQADVAIGITRGIPLAVSNVGGVDLLISGSWIPEVTERDVTVRATDGRFRAGFGARLGILQESQSVPGVSVTYLWRALPDADVTARSADDTLQVLGARVRAESWRVMASRQRAAFGVAAGIGQDRIDARAGVDAVVNDGDVRVDLGAPRSFSQKVTRTNAFANATVNFGFLRVVGEIGRSWGGSIATFNSFDGTSASEPRLYGSFGVRVGF